MYETPRKKGRPLTENERNLISHLLRLGHTQTDIAKVIGVYPSTICRELCRGEVELLNSDKWIREEAKAFSNACSRIIGAIYKTDFRFFINYIQ